MKPDTLFYQLFQNFPSIFFELMGQPTPDASNYPSTAPQVKQLPSTHPKYYRQNKTDHERFAIYYKVQFLADVPAERERWLDSCRYQNHCRFVDGVRGDRLTVSLQRGDCNNGFGVCLYCLNELPDFKIL
ncbi:DUF2887 domain-containing protein [Microcoleus sp. FACHB-53]|nr:DUF2887 domain-containing protein [Microcoleus sp. FACHB-53]